MLYVLRLSSVICIFNTCIIIILCIPYYRVVISNYTYNFISNYTYNFIAMYLVYTQIHEQLLLILRYNNRLLIY
jgi:hypothetical protein